MRVRGRDGVGGRDRSDASVHATGEPAVTGAFGGHGDGNRPLGFQKLARGTDLGPTLPVRTVLALAHRGALGQMSGAPDPCGHAAFRSLAPSHALPATGGVRPLVPAQVTGPGPWPSGPRPRLPERPGSGGTSSAGASRQHRGRA